jgi:hypothetical protein
MGVVISDLPASQLTRRIQYFVARDNSLRASAHAWFDASIKEEIKKRNDKTKKNENTPKKDKIKKRRQTKDVKKLSKSQTEKKEQKTEKDHREKENLFEKGNLKRHSI